MKKLILLVSTLFLGSFGLTAQSSLLVTNVSNSNSVITDGMTIYATVPGTTAATSSGTPALATNQIDINIKNISTSTKFYKMRMYYTLRHFVAAGDSSNPYFCFGGTCYQPDFMVSGKTETLTANQDAATSTTVTPNPGTGHPISIHYDEASIAGLSTIMYKIYDINNPSVDFMTFTVKYNDPTASIKANSSLLSYVSDVFPNPSNSKASIVVNAQSDLNNTSVSITNTLGAIVSSKNIELFQGKNTVSLEIETLPSGIYFATITSGNYKIVKKFTINK